MPYVGESRIARTDWGAIWAGVFTFVAIWSVFGVLGLAVFASAANPTATHPITGMSTGMGIWAVILTIIAMYVAGREAGHLAAIESRHDGLVHGMIMFGLSVASLLVITALGGMVLGGGNVSGSHNTYVLDLFAGIGWIGFVSLFLGWLAAMGGAFQGVQSRALSERPTQQVRTAA